MKQLRINTYYFDNGTISGDYALFLRIAAADEIIVADKYSDREEVANKDRILETMRHIPKPAPNPRREYTKYMVAEFRGKSKD